MCPGLGREVVEVEGVEGVEGVIGVTGVVEAEAGRDCGDRRWFVPFAATAGCCCGLC